MTFKRGYFFALCATLTAILTSCVVSGEKAAPTKRAEVAAMKDLDGGGVSVSLSHLGKTQYRAVGDNLIKNGGFELTTASGEAEDWKNSCWVYTTDNEERNRLRPAIEKISSRKISVAEKAEGANGAFISCSPEAAAIRGAALPDFSNRFYQYVSIPAVPTSKKLLLKFKYRFRPADTKGNNSLGILVAFYDNAEKPWQGKETGKYFFKTSSVSKDWKDDSAVFMLPEGAKSMMVDFRMYGCGEVSLDDVSLCPIAADEGVVMKLVPMDYIDNGFFLSSGQPGIMTFGFKNEKGIPPGKPFAFVELPAEIRMESVNTPSKIIAADKAVRGAEAVTVYKIDIGGIKTSFARDSYLTYQALSVLAMTSLPESDMAYQGRYWYEDGDYKTAQMPFDIKIIAPVKAAKPVVFQSGTMFARQNDFPDQAALEKLAAFYSGCGFNVVHGGSSPGFSAIVKRLGVKRYIQPYWLCNGYRIGQAKKPDGTKFMKADGTFFTDGGMDSICPVEVYNEGDYYRAQVVPALRKLIVEDESADSIMPNWEPYYYDHKGCFCPNCKEEFVKFSGLDKSEVEKLWPTDIVTKHRDHWMKFRSVQHGKMMVTFEKTINALGKEAGIESHFIPEIAWSQLIESDNAHFAQYNPVDYMDKLPVIDPWGPYIFHQASKTYEYNTGVHLITYFAARANKEFVAKRIPDPAKRPKLIALPHGLQCNDWVTEPEAIAFDTLCFFVNGWEGSIAYYFPAGYDARYWKALAETNNAVAAFEVFTLKGKRIDLSKATPLTPLPPVNCPEYWSEGGNFKEKLPELKNNPSMLQVAEYELDGKRLISAGNFWEKGEAFFNLKVNGLPGGKYVLREPLTKRCFANADGGIALSGVELGKGVMLHVGALRWAFFVVEPFRENVDYGKVITPEEMDATMAERLPTIGNAMAFEKEKAAKNVAGENVGLPDYSKISGIKQGALSLAVEKAEPGSAVKVALNAPESRLVIDLAKGGRISSWKASERELVFQDKTMGLAVDAFWLPVGSGRVTGPYEFESQDISDKAVSLRLKRVLTEKDNNKLAGMTLLKTITLSDSGRKLDISTEVINTTDAALTFSFRYHNMSAFVEILNACSGTAVMKDGEKEVTFKREFLLKMFKMRNVSDPELEAATKLDNEFRIDSDKVVFESPNFPFKAVHSVSRPNELFGYAFWDAGNLACSTFESLFTKVTLPPRKSWSAAVSWKLE